MASISTGSTIDVNSLVTQLIAAERAPTDKRFTAVETTTRAQISAFGQIASSISGLESAIKRFDGSGSLPGRKATVAADAGYAASAGTAARLGSYSISVERLATAHKLQSAPVASDTQVGHGRLSIRVGSGTTVDVDIASGKGTLADIRDAINAAGAGKGFTATLVRGDSGDVLTLASTGTGTAGALTISASGGDGGLAVLATSGGSLTQITAAQDAKVSIDGVVRTSSSNTLTDALDGVTLTLTKADPGKPFSLDVQTDASPLKASLLVFVSSYNTALSQMRTLSAAGTDKTTAGTLAGDATPRALQQRLRGLVTSSYAELSALGFKTAVDGSLTLDGAKFDAAIAKNPSAVDNLLGGQAPLGKQLRETMKSYIGAGSVLQNRTDSLNGRLKDLTRQRDNYEVRIEQLTTQYRAQFSALDALMGSLQTTSSYLQQQLASLTTS